MSQRSACSFLIFYNFLLCLLLKYYAFLPLLVSYFYLYKFFLSTLICFQALIYQVYAESSHMIIQAQFFS